MKNTIVSVFALLFAVSFLASQTFAHVTVKPTEVVVGARQIFAVSVPTEKDIPTIGVRLVIPEGLASVRPNVKPGWTIEIKKSGEGEDAKVTEIIWTGGAIPADQRDEFLFSAQAPAKETKIIWKAYQTYENGSIVAWDQEPKEDDSHAEENTGPYSETTIINDLEETPTPTEKNTDTNIPLIVSILAFGMSAGALWLQFQRKQS